MVFFDPLTGRMIEVIAPNLFLMRTPIGNTLVYVFGDDPRTGEPITYNHCLN
jgi:hypothetical protein